MSCTQHLVYQIPLCGSGSTKFIQDYLERNIGTPLMVNMLLHIRIYNIIYEGVDEYIILIYILETLIPLLF